MGRPRENRHSYACSLVIEFEHNVWLKVDLKCIQQICMVAERVSQDRAPANLQVVCLSNKTSLPSFFAPTMDYTPGMVQVQTGQQVDQASMIAALLAAAKVVAPRGRRVGSALLRMWFGNIVVDIKQIANHRSSRVAG